MKTEEEIRAKMNEASEREQKEDNPNGNPAEKHYCSTVYDILGWVLDEGDDPFEI